MEASCTGYDAPFGLLRVQATLTPTSTKPRDPAMTLFLYICMYIQRENKKGIHNSTLF